MSTTPDLFEKLNKLGMRALIQSSENRPSLCEQPANKQTHFYKQRYRAVRLEIKWGNFSCSNDGEKCDSWKVRKGGGLAPDEDPAGLKVDKHTAVCIHCKLIGNRGGWWWIRTALDVENRNQDPVTVTKDVPWKKTCDVQSSSSHTNCFQSPAAEICLKSLWSAKLMHSHIEPCVLTGLGPHWNYGNHNLHASLSFL